jgi:Leucine-rich repeat (LRR) protein
MLNNLTDLPKILNRLTPDINLISWLDVSFNNLEKIDETLLLLLNLKVLYLHANQITNINEMDKLGQLKQLRNLTMHGNPLESTRGYRYLALKKIPQLKHLDFCAITKADRVIMKTSFHNKLL